MTGRREATPLTARVAFAPLAIKKAMNALKASIAIISLSGCATLQSALLPTPVACAPKDSPAKPQTLPNDLLAKMDDYHLVLVIQYERLVLIDYAGKASAIIESCR